MEEFTQDYLTGLLNRQGLYEWYNTDKKLTVLQFMFLDLDNFKNVNDTYGHNVGDKLLIKISDIIKKSIDGVICARLGGDEFVLVIQGEYAREQIETTAQTIINEIEEKKGLEWIATDISASIGILLNEDAKQPLNDILFKIDIAMYRAKGKGKACYVVFNDIADQVFSELEMEHQQVEALQNQEFQIYCKPIVNAQTSMIFATQACLVWKRKDGEFRTQDEFLPVFEKNGFIKILNMWQIEEICILLSKAYVETGIKRSASLNISRLLILEKTLTYTLKIMTEQYKIEPWQLCFELEESAFSRGVESVLEGIDRLSSDGYKVALIEVGKDFSSLRFWDCLHLEYISLSKEYLEHAMSTFKGKQIVKTLISMGRDLKTKVVADGIVNKEQVSFLRNCGCSAISGPYYSVALPLIEYDKYSKGRMVDNEQKTVFPFRQNFDSSDGLILGKPQGKGLSFTQGISDEFGAVCFQGGESMQNVVELPGVLMSTDSYTIGVWVKQTERNAWASVIYARYLEGFMSYNPYVMGGNSSFRISEDADANGFHDILGREVKDNDWNFICLTYDAAEGVSGYYINGRKIFFLQDVPLLYGCKQIVLGGDPFQSSYKGYLSALTFYDNAKSEEEIREWYNEFIFASSFYGKAEKFWE